MLEMRGLCWNRTQCMQTYIYIYLRFSKTQLYLRDQLHACAWHTCIDHILPSSHDSLRNRTSRALAQLSISFRCLRFLIERRY